eukprot:7150-Heterococcus_DN1.PRE.1
MTAVLTMHLLAMPALATVMKSSSALTEQRMRCCCSTSSNSYSRVLLHVYMESSIALHTAHHTYTHKP